MSFNGTKEVIEEGDTVVLYLSPQNMHSMEVCHKIKNKKGEMVENVFQTTYGALKVPSLIGKRYGSKVEMSRGWAFVLQPTPELWTVTLPHRTQIIYTPDISLIIHLLDLVPGSVVIETGNADTKKHLILKQKFLLGHWYRSYSLAFLILIFFTFPRNWKWIALAFADSNDKAARPSLHL